MRGTTLHAKAGIKTASFKMGVGVFSTVLAISGIAISSIVVIVCPVPSQS